MSYLGDAHVGEGTNVGAGTITANYDGVHKHHTEIGKDVFLGVDTMLRAPITLGDGARDRGGRRGHEGRPAGQAGGGRPRAPSRARGRLRQLRPRPRATRAAAADDPARRRVTSSRGGRLMGSLTEVAIVVGLTLLAGIFVAAEIALVSLRRSRLAQLVDENRRGAARVRRLVDDPARFLAVIQIAITFIGFLSSAVAAVALTNGLADLIAGIEWLEGSAEAIALITVTVLLSLFCDRRRRARPEGARPGLPGPDGAPPGRAGRPARPPPRARRRRPDLADPGHRAAVRRPRDEGEPDHRRGAQAHRGARRRGGDPRGRGGADDPRGHRARRAPRPRGDGPAHRHRRHGGGRRPRDRR